MRLPERTLVFRHESPTQLFRPIHPYVLEVVSMQQSSSGPVRVLRLDHGEDILESILKSAEGSMSTMLICTGLGMITDFELGYFDRGTYIQKSYSEPHELLSIQGSISSHGEPRVHAHVAVADKDHKVSGGHLLRGKVWMSNEIGIIVLDSVHSSREVDPVKKVAILNLG